MDAPHSLTPREPVSVASYRGAFERVSPLLPGQRLAWLRQAREDAIRRFSRLGFPTRHDEEWKYTNIAPIADGRFSVMPPPSSTHLASVVRRHALPGAHLFVFINGQVEPGLCRIGKLPSGVVLRNLAYALDHHPPPLVESTLRGADREAAVFSDLNLAFMADGAYLGLPAGCVLEKPLQLLFIAGEGTPAIQPRNIIDIGEGSSVTVIEHYVAQLGTPYFTNAVSEIAVGPGASLSHYKLEQEDRQAFHIATIRIAQAAGSRVVSGSYALGGRLARSCIELRLTAADASCRLDGLYVADGHQLIDHHTRVDHLQARGSSHQLYKGIIDGAARAVFNGRVVVHPGAGKSDASQANHNLLLSANAEIDTQPRLEIHADDVRCSHGATVGSLDDEQLFYLRSRGIDSAAARSLLTHAFAGEVIERIDWPPLRERVGQLVEARLTRH